MDNMRHRYGFSVIMEPLYVQADLLTIEEHELGFRQGSGEPGTLVLYTASAEV